MKKTALFLFVLFYALQGSAYAVHVKGSGRIIKEARNLEVFDRISVTGTCDLHVSQDPQQSLSVETDDNIMKHVRTRVMKGELVIDLQPDNISIEPSKKIVIRVQMAKLGGLNVIGVANVYMKKIKADRLVISLDGVGEIDCRELHARDLDVTVGGAGTVTLAGDAAKQKIAINGTGGYKGGGLKGGSVKVDINGTGNAEVWAEEVLDVAINGVGDVSYYGNPRDVRKNINGVGGVKKLGSRK